MYSGLVNLRNPVVIIDFSGIAIAGTKIGIGALSLVGTYMPHAT